MIDQITILLDWSSVTPPDDVQPHSRKITLPADTQFRDFLHNFPPNIAPVPLPGDSAGDNPSGNAGETAGENLAPATGGSPEGKSDCWIIHVTQDPQLFDLDRINSHIVGVCTQDWNWIQIVDSAAVSLREIAQDSDEIEIFYSYLSGGPVSRDPAAIFEKIASLNLKELAPADQ